MIIIVHIMLKAPLDELLPFAFGCMFLKLLLTLNGDPLLLENLNFLGEISVDGVEKVFIYDAFC